MSEAHPHVRPVDEPGAPTPPIPGLGRRLLVLALGPLALGLFQLASAFPWAVEALYASRLGPLAVRIVTTVTGLTTLPFVELVVLAVVTGVGWSLIRELRATGARGRHRGWGIASWLLVTADVASVLTALFYLLWGFNYARPSLEARLGWEEVREIEADELERLATQALQATNEAYRSLHRSDDLGEPTSMPRDRSRLEHALVEGWASAAAELGLDRSLGRSLGPPKVLLLDGVLTELGLLGFYFPYTGEAVVNGRAPAVILPRSMAHEQAHQRGIAPEDEASFMAVMATVRAPHPLLRYAGYATVQRRLLNDLAAADRTRALELGRSRLPGVERDARALEEFYRSLEGPVNELAERMNDAYLRHHRVEGGAQSYGLVTRLLVAYARQRGGALPSP